jgi:hypothetical protein
VPLDAVDLIQKLLAQDPKERLGPGSEGKEKLRNHLFFQGIDFEQIGNGNIEPMNLQTK